MVKLLFVLIAAMSISACSGKEKYTLEYKLSAGDSFKYKTTGVATVSQSMMGQDVTSVMDVDMKLHYNVTNVQENDFTIEMTYDAMKMDMNMTMGENSMNIVMDSDTEATTITMEDMGPMVKAMMGIPIEMTISKKGEVLSVVGFEKMTESMATAAGENLSPQEKAQMQQMMEQQMNSETIKSAFEQMSSYLPEKPVSIGESWNSAMAISANGINCNIDMKLILNAVEDNVAIIGVDGIISTSEGATQTMQGMEVAASLSGTMTGTVHIDMNNGFPVMCELNQDMAGTISVMGMEIPMSMKSESTISKQ